MKHKGEIIAREFLDNTENFVKLNQTLIAFHKLDFEQKNRFLCYVAGAIQRYREDLAGK